jgi:hypothetical protein
MDDGTSSILWKKEIKLYYMHASQKLSLHKKFSLPHYEKKEDDSILND